MTETINAFQMAQRQFDHVAGQLNMDPQIAELLRWPSREFKFQVPVRMDDGSIRLFLGYRVQHSDVRGPCKGRHSLPPIGDTGHRPCAGDVDDLEMRRCRYPAWRRKRRRPGRSSPAFRE